MNIPDKQKKILDELDKLDNWEDKISYIMDKGVYSGNLPESYKSEAFLVKECQSKLWLYGESKENKIYFHAHSETVIVRGIVGMIFEIYSGHSPEEILNNPLELYKIAGFRKLFSNRITGIEAVNHAIINYAYQFRRS